MRVSTSGSREDIGSLARSLVLEARRLIVPISCIRVAAEKSARSHS